jgi:hypothetical protein
MVKRYYDNSRPIGPIKQSNQLIVGVDCVICFANNNIMCKNVILLSQIDIIFSILHPKIDVQCTMGHVPISKLWDFEGNDCKLLQNINKKGYWRAT